jgi:predicted MPP superfamily phosphohydrolase
MPINNTQQHTIPGDREDGSSSFVHRAIILSGKIGEISPLYLLPLWFVLFYLTLRLWHTPIIILLSFTMLCADWLILGLLPVKNRSWGPVTPSLLSLSLIRFGLRLVCGLLLQLPWNLILTFLLEFFLLIAVVYATWVEPFTIQLTHLNLPIPERLLKKKLNILHISDIHFEDFSPREKRLLEIINAVSPDVILLTGDYLNLSSVYNTDAQLGVKDILRHMNAPLGVYAVTGSPAVDRPHHIPDIFTDLPIRWLQDEVVHLPLDGSSIYLIGIRNTYNEKRDIHTLNRMVNELPDPCISILLYHTPDLMPTATQLGIDLYLCGHTHGGQISLPFYGALVTSSKFGKRYERGLYHENHTRLYVSRGLGVEGMGAPRARFCSPPEVILWTLVPQQDSHCEYVID